jgi:4-hydroxy-tetrahydrodipicolinate synthase
MKVNGIWLPIITPFKNNEIDYKSYKLLIDNYIEKGISGIIPLGTTGEIPTVSDKEYFTVIEKTMEYADSRIPVYIGCGGNYTDKVLKLIREIEQFKIDGILSVCPYYNRPDQRGIYKHFQAISESTDLNIIIYNIPFRTGRNITNETLLRLAELKNIVALKDSCGDLDQSTELLLNKPEKFSILTGEDILLYINLMYGGDGGITASAHIETEKFVNLYNDIQKNDHVKAFQEWKHLSEIIPLLFKEPNPAPVKYFLSRMGMIDSPETRLPLVEITAELKEKIDALIKR